MQNDTIVTIGVICVIVFIAWAILHDMIHHRIMLKRKCTLSIKAKCIGKQSNYDKDGTTYAPIYQIEYKEETLTLVSSFYSQYCILRIMKKESLRSIHKTHITLLKLTEK